MTLMNEALIFWHLHVCRFPGTAKAYHAIQECVDARLLMKAAIYTATHPEVHLSQPKSALAVVLREQELQACIDGCPWCCVQGANSFNMTNGEEKMAHRSASGTHNLTGYRRGHRFPFPSAGDVFRWVR